MPRPRRHATIFQNLSQSPWKIALKRNNVKNGPEITIQNKLLLK